MALGDAPGEGPARSAPGRRDPAPRRRAGPEARDLWPTGIEIAHRAEPPSGPGPAGIRSPDAGRSGHGVPEARPPARGRAQRPEPATADPGRRRDREVGVAG